MAPGFWGIVLVVLLIVLLFGRGKISALMGDLAKGITSFRKGLKDGSDDDESGGGDADDDKSGGGDADNEGEEESDESDKS